MDIKESIRYLTDTDRYPKQESRPIEYPKLQISYEEYNSIVSAIQQIAENATNGRQAFDVDVADGCVYLENNNDKEQTFEIGADGQLYVEYK